MEKLKGIQITDAVISVGGGTLFTALYDSFFQNEFDIYVNNRPATTALLDIFLSGLILGIIVMFPQRKSDQ